MMLLRTTPKLAKRAQRGERLDGAFCPVGYDFAKSRRLELVGRFRKGRQWMFFFLAKGEGKRLRRQRRHDHFGKKVR
jgi:hypothetical protein